MSAMLEAADELSLNHVMARNCGGWLTPNRAMRHKKVNIDSLFYRSGVELARGYAP
jgi:hypothetical protein